MDLKSSIPYHCFCHRHHHLDFIPLYGWSRALLRRTAPYFSTAGSPDSGEIYSQQLFHGMEGFGKISLATFFKTPSFHLSGGPHLGIPGPPPWWPTDLPDSNSGGKSILFAAMLLSMMLPAQVLMIPASVVSEAGLGGTPYMPLTVPYFFAIQDFCVPDFQLYQRYSYGIGWKRPRLTDVPMQVFYPHHAASYKAGTGQGLHILLHVEMG